MCPFLGRLMTESVSAESSWKMSTADVVSRIGTNDELVTWYCRGYNSDSCQEYCLRGSPSRRLECRYFAADNE